MKGLEKSNIQNKYKKEWEAFQIFGDMNALSFIYAEMFDLLLNYGRKFCSEESLIEDAIQNIFTNLIRGREKLGVINNAKQYLIVSHRNELFELVRKSRKTISTENLPEMVFKPVFSREEEIVKIEGEIYLDRFLKESLLMLTPHQQEALFLKFNVGLSYEEISKTLHISVESCRTNIYRSLKLIRVRFESYRK